MAIVNVTAPWAADWYTDLVVAGIRDTLAAHGHEIALHILPYGGSTREKVTELLDERLHDEECFGAVIVGFRLREHECQRLLAHGKPLVVTGGVLPWLPSVRIDDEAAARIATEHLIGLGHRSIVHVAGKSVMPHDFAVWGERIRGYTAAMEAAGCGGATEVRPCDARPEEALRVGRQLMGEASRPAAVFAGSDGLAYGVWRAAMEAGVAIPGELSIVAINDQPESEQLGLTTVRQRPAETGVAAAERLLGLTSGDLRLMPISLVERTSTSAPRTEKRGAGLLGRLFRRA